MNLTRLLTRLALGRRLPCVDGRLEVEGVGGAISLSRDAHGVLYVDAASAEDAWFGLGFGHGQDRAGQLEVIVRLLRGTLAEVLGPDGLPLDLLTRRLGVHRAGAAQYREAPMALQRQFDAYAAGINAAYDVIGRKPSHEHALLGVPGTRWRGEDCQTFAAYLCFMLAANWDIELLRLRILESDGVPALMALDAHYPGWLPSVLGEHAMDISSIDRLTQDLNALTPLMGLGGGSNAWAIAGSKTHTGRPILSNDPHLMPSAPSQWYLTRLKCPEWQVSGASFVGTAAIGSGHNSTLAWGVTAGHADHTDLFLEEVSPDGLSVRQGSEFVACERREERIGVKGKPDHVEEVLITPRGPLVGGSFGGQKRAMSLSATWLKPRPYLGIFRVHTARTCSEAQALFEAASTTNVGLVLAHKDGEIAYLLAADLPVRKKGFGLVPAPGWDARYGWEEEPLPADKLPRVFSPTCGFVAAANAKPAENRPDAYLGDDWLDGFRQARITEALAAKDDWTVTQSMALQMCTRSLPWERMKGWVLAAAQQGGVPDEARRTLEGWDGLVEATSVGATLFEHLLASLVRRLVRENAPNAAPHVLGRGATELLPYSVIITRRVGQLIGVLTQGEHGPFGARWQDVIAEELGATYSRLKSRYGPLSEAWQWGRVRPMTLAHPFAQKKLLAGLFNIGPIPGRGDASTVHQGAMDLEDPSANVVGCATMRATIDVGAWSESRFVILGGQSGNPLSPHYDDHVALWEAGAGVPIHWDDAALQEATVATLRLSPRDGAPGA